MKFKVFSELSYDVYSTSTFFFNIQAINTSSQTILEESLSILPSLKYEEFELDNIGTRFIKLEVPKGVSFTIKYNAIVEVLPQSFNAESLKVDSPIISLGKNIFPYISPSRHCESDKFIKLSRNEFGVLPTDLERVLAINQWVNANIEYIPGSTNSSTSAYDTYVQREGVCKDFAHLAIALCRAIDIPARYFCAYATNLNPPDFHACYEAYIGGKWIVFDPTKLCSINGLVKIANGRDATELAVASFFGNINCTYMNIQCDPIEDSFVPYSNSNEPAMYFSY